MDTQKNRIMPTTDAQYTSFFDLIDNEKPELISLLSEWVAVKSISTNFSCRPHVVKMVEIAEKLFSTLGAKMFTVANPLKSQFSPDGDEIPLPPILLGTYPEVPCPDKKTLLIYGHLDVQPAQKSDGWDTDPWVLTEKNDKLYGRGSTDDKAPILGWFFALQSFKKLGIELPVNLKFCFEAMEESNSEGLNDLIFQAKPDYFNQGIDGTVISDNYWLGTDKPCLTYGLRGIGCWAVEVECASCDLHSGLFGGTVHEAMTDLIKLLGTLVDNKGNVLVKGINELVDPLSEEEEEIYRNMDFDHHAFADSIKGHLIHASKEKTLQHRWRYPCCSIHGIEGAFYEPGEKTVIPKKVIGKFSIRIVPSITGEKIAKLVKEHFDREIKELNSPNKIRLIESDIDNSWYGNPNGFLFEAGKAATKRVYKVEPDLTREGGSIPVTISFQNATKKDVILVPMGASDDGAHSQNEKINIRNYIEGTKLLGSFLLELEGRN